MQPMMAMQPMMGMMGGHMMQGVAMPMPMCGMMQPMMAMQPMFGMMGAAQMMQGLGMQMLMGAPRGCGVEQGGASPGAASAATSSGCGGRAMADMSPMGPMMMFAANPMATAVRGEKSEAEGRKQLLLKDLEEAGARLEARGPDGRDESRCGGSEGTSAWDKRKRKWVLSEAGISRRLETGGERRESSGQLGASLLAQGEAGAANSCPTGESSASGDNEDQNGGEEGRRCHLHPPKKPNQKCKFCQRVQGLAAAAAARSAGALESSRGGAASSNAGSRIADPPDVEDYSRRVFNCSPMLKDQILGSTYFKSLLALTSLEDLVDEIARYADTLDVYNHGSTVSPSCFICQVYRLFTLPQAEDLAEIQALLGQSDCSVVRCASFLYMRLVVNPAHIWERMEEYLFDGMEIRVADTSMKLQAKTIGEYVEALLKSDKYFNTPLPRMPAKVRMALEKELAPLPVYRKRMEANQSALRSKRLGKLPVEVIIDGAWVEGILKEFVGRGPVQRQVLVRLEDGSTLRVHLGKVVLRDASSDGGGSGSEGEHGHRFQRRSRSRDWSRWKGKDELEMVEELREKAKEEAVCGHGKSYARRPFTVEEELWRREPETRVSLLGPGEEAYGATTSRPREVAPRSTSRSRTATPVQDKELLEARRRMRDIYEKYGSASRPSVASCPAKDQDMDEPEVMRLG